MIQKKHLFITTLLLLCSMYFGIGTSNAQTPTKGKTTPTPTTVTPTESDSVIDKLKQIELLKEKIATKVAEIREKDKAAYFGEVKKITSSTITLATSKGEQSINYAQDTLFYTVTDSGKTETQSNKVKEKDKLVVFGYVSDNKSFASKYVYIQNKPIHVVGKIADIDSEDFSITVRDKQGNQIVDIETTTKINIFGKDKSKQKGGFSRLRVGDIVHITGTTNATDEKRITAANAFVIQFLNQQAQQPTATPTGKVSPTGATKPSITPTGKVSTPTPTKKPTQ